VDTDAILAGRWRVFGGVQLQVDDPPRWHKDYLAGVDLATDKPAHKLDHRKLPRGADIKLIWEPSRWNQLVRLAQASYVLDDNRAGQKCIDWLNNWVETNPPLRGWNWTSALESGFRLIAFSWIDALLSHNAKLGKDLELLRKKILPAHAEFTWRCRSFGSSANNHIIGELAGLIIALARWPELEKHAAPLERLQTAWETEVLAQFWEDGGNKEQALNYHLFAWEFCWQARPALLAVGRSVSRKVSERIERAARFYWDVQARLEPWDYGDSDNAYVTPLFSSEKIALQEWRDWMKGAFGKTAYEFWLGPPPELIPKPGRGSPLHVCELADHWVYPQTGMCLAESGFWWLRWDLSQLGYLKPAAHGHSDAQHLSIWYNGVAMVIDPGTAVYYPQPDLRSWLASREAHNGPCVVPASGEPKRLGPFLWSHHHSNPKWRKVNDAGVSVVESEMQIDGGRIVRSIARRKEGDGWLVLDRFDSPGHSWVLTVRWQFAPETFIKALDARRFEVKRRGVAIVLEVGDSWTDVRLIERESDRGPMEPRFAGTVSPTFRRTVFAPYLLLRAPGGEKPCVFRTAFLACEAP